MPETYTDVPRRVSTLCEHVLACTELDARTGGAVSLDDIGRVVGLLDAFQSELTHNLGIALPENFNASWWDLEIVYAVALESRETEASAPEMTNDVVELVGALRASVREVERTHGLKEE